MIIAVAANDLQWKELVAGNAKAGWIRVTDINEFFEQHNADVFFNLNENACLFDYSSLKIPVIINSVTKTLEQLNAPPHLLRINGWSGFLQRSVWEIAGVVDEKIKAVFDLINKKITVVKDEPGFIAARVVAMITNEAYFALEDGVSTKSEIDTAMKLGTNYPFGPFEWGETIGLANMLTLLLELSSADKRYQPAALLVKEATENKP